MTKQTEQLTHWAVGLLLLLGAYVVMTQGQLLAAGMFALAGALLMPPVWQWLLRRSNRPLSGNVRLAGVAALGITASMLMSSQEGAEASREIAVLAKHTDTVLCLKSESFETVVKAQDPINQKLDQQFHDNPEKWVHAITSTAYFDRMHAVSKAKLDALVAEGQCILVPLDAPLTTARKNLQLADDTTNLPIVPVQYQGRSYWGYARGLKASVGTSSSAQSSTGRARP